MGDAMSEGTSLSTSGSSHHKQRPLMMVHSKALRVVEACQKAHTSTLEGGKRRSEVKFVTHYALHRTDHQLEESQNSCEKPSVELKHDEKYKRFKRVRTK
jgi:hypothetical protein